MAATSSGKHLRPRRLAKGGTTSTRKHRFESFNQRIAKLNIDPIRRRRRNEIEQDDLSTSDSFFRTSLDQWRDLNLSETFTSFVKEVEPICNSLPQVLHYHQRIFEILVSYIERRETVSLEPLLDILRNFAHDLGVRFEAHFGNAITLVASLAAKHTDVEVIEWSFTCLAWLFKYLSRLLVPDLRPTFEIMAPLLGREPQKVHTTRFAAEAMSFLVRKAASVYVKDQRPLVNVMDAIRNDMSKSLEVGGAESKVRLYQHGLMTLLLESMKGIERKLHSSATRVYSCLIDGVLAQGESLRTGFEHVVCGVTVALVHHCDAENFRPILDVVLEKINAMESTAGNNSVAACGRLLFIVCTVRKGTRVQDWAPVLVAMMTLLNLCPHSSYEAILEVYKAAAVILQSSTLDLVLPTCRLAMKVIASEELAAHFLPFCNYFCDIGRQRFHELLFHDLSKFIVSRWQENELELFISLPKILDINFQKKPVCPAAWQERIIKTLEEVNDREEEVVVRCTNYLTLMDYLSVAPTSKSRMMEALNDLVDQELLLSGDASSIGFFAFGDGLRVLLRHFPRNHLIAKWQKLCAQATRYGSFPPFLEATLLLAEGNEIETDGIDPLVDQLAKNAYSSSHELRKLSLQIVDALYTKQYGEHSDIVSTALAIESSPLDLQSARTISMQVRKLASQYETASSHKWLRKVVPHFCFGLLNFKLSQVWEDATAALKQICETKVGEEIVSSLAFQWLEEPRISDTHDGSMGSTYAQQGPLTDFQCSNLIHVESLINDDILHIARASKTLQDSFDASHMLLDKCVEGLPALALRVLLAVPHVAEKRSRQLVPLFLSWAIDENERHADTTPEDAEVAMGRKEDSAIGRLTKKEQKATLDLFANFHNPKVLYRSSEVFQALQGLLTNGNVETQRSALRALFAWKCKGLQPYQENLLNLLDDARFRDEISTFLQVDEQNSVIQDEHRAELMPVVTRLLYGKMIGGTGSGSTGQAVKRKAVLRALSRLDGAYLRDFVDVSLGRLSNVNPIGGSDPCEELVGQELMSIRKQVGLINMMKDMLEVLGDRLAAFAQSLTNALMYCMVRAARELRSQKDDSEQNSEKGPQTSLLRVIRQTGLQCLNLLFKCCPALRLRPWVSTIFAELISPRLDKLAVESAQSVSGILQLFSTWSSSPDAVFFLVESNARTIGSVVGCLEVPSAKDEVKLFVLDDILKRIVELSKQSFGLVSDASKDSVTVSQRVLQPNMDIILSATGSLLRKSPSRELLGSTVRLISGLAPLVEGSSHVVNLLEICTFLLDQPSHRVNPRAKGELLQVLQHFLPLIKSDLPTDLQDQIFRTVTSLFGYFKDSENRTILSQVMSVLADKDTELQDIAQLCISLNAFSTSKIDQPDFDERLRAFNAINESKYQDFTPKQWRPILYNMLFFVKDSEEMAIRSNASYALRRFVESNLAYGDNDKTDTSDPTKTVLLPALRTGISESSELVRTEYLTIMAHLIRHNPQWEAINDMSVLLVGDDEEASFFGNILHIQQHRRLRALRRLATEASQGTLLSTNVAHFFIPLIEHFVFDKADDEIAHNLSAETVVTIGALASSLEWPQFRAVFRRYSGYIQSKPDVQKTVIKLLGAVIDSLAQAAVEKNAIAEGSGPDIHMVGLPQKGRAKSALAATMPRKEKLTDDLTNNLLPSLEKYLHEKDESTVSLRVPVAVSVVKLLKVLPSEKLRDRLPPVLTDVCHILRSRAQESRDLTRKTLVDISTLIGPGYFGFVLKELRSSLARGYQLHVLSYTVHSILVATSSIFQPGDLDYCLPQIVAIVMDDIFGVTGQEKDAEEYISKMKEVKSSKSFDSMDLVAKTATVDHLVHLIRPLQVLLEEKLDLRTVKKIDELLRRIGVGLLRNDAIRDQRVLIFCYEIIQEVYSKEPRSDRTSKEDHRTKRFLINYKGANKAGFRGSTSSYNYKLARFALDILRTVLHKYDDLQTPANLDGFVPIIGDAIIQSNEEVQTSALRLLTTIIKVPLKAMDENAAIYVSECVKIVKATTSTNVELAQAALKLVSAVLRERRSVEIRETDLAYLLKRLIPDLEEPDKQGVAFNFLKAIMTRKIVITEVYEVLDTVAAIMVTNQTKAARIMARGAYFQFIMDYPQSKDRFLKQLGFLVRNLDYKHQEGRQSVMEALHLLFNKVGGDLVQDIVSTFFVPLVMVIVNDESSQCREMAGALLKKIFERADVEQTQSILGMLRAWLAQQDELLLTRVALQVYNLYLDASGTKAETEIPQLRQRITQILKSNLKIPGEADWELLFFALQTFSKICQMFSVPSLASNTASLWASVRQCLSFPHAWVKLSSAKLIGIYFADFARTNAGNEDLSLPLKGSGGLLLSEEEIVEVTRSSLGLLRVPGIGEDLGSQSVRNLVFLGKIMAQTSMTWPQRSQDAGEADSSGDENDQEEEDDTFEGFDDPCTTPTSKPALGHLIMQTSRILRRGTLSTRAQSLIPLQASLSLLGALLGALPLLPLTPHIPTLLLPLHNLTDPAIPHPFSTDAAFTDGYKMLVGNAQELMALLQKKLGTTEYINLMSGVREGVKARREGRRVKRRIDVVAEPERAGKLKMRKGERKRERRKERSGEERGRRRGW